MATKKEESKKLEKLAKIIEKVFYGIIFLAIFACLAIFIDRIYQKYSAKNSGQKQTRRVSANEKNGKMPVNGTTPTGSPVPKVSPAAPGDPVQDKAIKELQDFYNTYHETAKTGDFPKIRTFISRDHQKLFDSWDAKTTEANGQHIKNNLAKDMEFKGGKVDGDMGYLWINGSKVKGLLDGKELKYCLVTFRKEDGQWKIVKEHWADRPGNLQ